MCVFGKTRAILGGPGARFGAASGWRKAFWQGCRRQKLARRLPGMAPQNFKGLRGIVLFEALGGEFVGGLLKNKFCSLLAYYAQKR